MRLAILALAPALAWPSPARGEPALSVDRFYVRGGVLHMSPRSHSRELVLSDVHGPASLAIGDGPIAGSGAAIDPVTVPAVIVGYVLPALDDRLAIETVLGAPLHVRFRATGTLASMSIAPDALGLPTGVPALGSQLGEADAVPPLVTLVYRPVDLGPVHPYVGAGASVMFTYNARATNAVLTAAAPPTFHIDPAAGLVVQGGLDVRLWHRVFARADVKYIAFMTTHATVSNLEVMTPDLPLFGATRVGTATMELAVNPWIVQLGVGVDL